MANKRKTTTAIVAGVTAVALLLGGTFAWTSISQQAKNETAGIVNVGGRLHDDFDGTNKDVYVENFTDPLNGGQPIYARIKLTEYMEVGQDAGGFGADVNGDGKTTAVPVISGTSIDDKDNWPAHIPAEYCSTCETGDTCVIHEHWKWTMGGEGDNNGQTTFMPTFNKDKDSLEADINGTYHGTDDTDKVYYDDYVVYTTDGTTGATAVPFDTKETVDGEINSVTGTAYYDDDTNTDENDHATGAGVRTETETHTAKETAEGSVITMDEWINTYNKAPGNYWVYDTDGWAYWANPIMPGEATGLLLDGIVMEKNPGEKCYYAINVVGQFATVNDWEYFTDSAPSEKAMELLTAASQNVATVTVTNVDGKTTVEPGDTVNFSASVTVNGQQVLAASDFEWSVLNANLTASTSSTIENGVLTVGDGEYSQNLIIVAKAKDEAYLGALGMSSVAVNVVEQTGFALRVNDGTYVERSVETGLYTLGQRNTFTIQAEFGNTTFGDDLVWTAAYGDGTALTNTTWTVSDNKAIGTLTVGETETANEIVVTAKYTVSDDEVYTASYRLLSANFVDTNDLSVEPYVMLTSDGDTGYTMYYVRTNADMTDASGYTIAGQTLTGAYAGTGNWYNNVDGWGSDWSYSSVHNKITGAVFINKMQPTTTRSWFWDMGYLKTVTDLKRLDTSEVTTMESMFQACWSLEGGVDVSAFDTSKVTSMNNMFFMVPGDIHGLENFDTSNVSAMSQMFGACTGITELDLSGWDVSNVTVFSYMFEGAKNLTSINAENWDTSSATMMMSPFKNCNLLELDCSKWNVDQVWAYDDFNTNAPGVTAPTWVITD